MCSSIIHVALNSSSAGPICLRLKAYGTLEPRFDISSGPGFPASSSYGCLTPNLFGLHISIVLVPVRYHPSLPLTFSRLYMLFRTPRPRRMAVSFSCHISSCRATASFIRQRNAHLASLFHAASAPSDSPLWLYLISSACTHCDWFPFPIFLAFSLQGSVQ